MVRKFEEDLGRRLQDVEFAKGFGAALAKADFAVTLADARYRCGVTQASLARELGTTQSYIAKLERGDANPTIGAIGKLLAVLGLCLSTNAVPLMSRISSMPTTQEIINADNKEIRFALGTSPEVVADIKSDPRDIATVGV